MKELFILSKAYEPPVEWYVWFDDDSHVTKNDWFSHMKKYIDEKKKENICYIGEAWNVPWLAGQWDFIAKSKWYKGKQPDIVKGKPGIHFATGGYWWLRRDIADQLDWSDERLTWAGGDTLLAEAIRQQGLPFHRYKYGVKINDSKRRGVSMAPAGCTNPNVRR